MSEVSDPPSPVTIRLLRVSDCEQYVALLSQLTDVGNSWTREKIDQMFYILDINPMIHVFVALMVEREEDGSTSSHATTVVAAATLLMEPKFIHGGSMVAHIEDVVVASSVRGRQIGSKLLHHLINEARDLGAYKVILDCSDDVKKFYTKNGFTESGAQMRYNIL